MALIKCTECKKEISSQAKSCPGCGAKVKRPGSPIVKLFLIFLGIGMFASVMVDGKSKKESTSSDPVRDAQLQLAAMWASKLKNSMKDPQSFELNSLVVKPNGAACYKYRAMNSFGAKLPSSAVLSSKGAMLLEDKDGSEFIDAWNDECTRGGGDDIADFIKRKI